MIDGFLTVFSHTIQDEEGKYKNVKVEEFYAHETFIEAETAINETHEDIACGEGLFIESIQRATFEDIVFNQEESDEELFWYRVSVKFVSGETPTGKPRYKTVFYLIQAQDGTDSINICNWVDLMQLPDSEVVATVKTKIVEIYL